MLSHMGQCSSSMSHSLPAHVVIQNKNLQGKKVMQRVLSRRCLVRHKVLQGGKNAGAISGQHLVLSEANRGHYDRDAIL